ncbi:hypothetical protein [Paenibacillus sp. 1A_MP2]
MIPISDEVMNVLSQRLKLGKEHFPISGLKWTGWHLSRDGQKSSGIWFLS